MNSMASFHIKIEPTGIYKATFHDCNNSIRLWGDLSKKEGIEEAKEKMKALRKAIEDFENHIRINY